MKRVLTAVALILVVLLAVFKAPAWMFGFLCAGVALLAVREFLALVEGHGIQPLRKTTYVCTIALFTIAIAPLASLPSDRSAVIMPLASALGVFALAPLILVLAMKGLEPGQRLPSAATAIAGICYVFLPFVCLMGLRVLGNDGWFFLLFLFLSVWSGDISAYYVGRNFGRHKLAPSISPNKTWEGTVASVLGSLVVAWCWVWFAPPLSVWLHRVGLTGETLSRERAELFFPPLALVGVAVATNLAAQFGDLAESMLKRGAGVKDSGTLIPGHGGVLDRIDALLFAAPVVWYYALFLAIQGA